MSVLESAPVSSTVGRVFAKDLDEGINAEMKYTIVDGDGADAFDINTDPNFQVGIITVKKVIQIILMESLNCIWDVSKGCCTINMYYFKSYDKYSFLPLKNNTKNPYSFCLHVNTSCVIILQRGYKVVIKINYKYVISPSSLLSHLKNCYSLIP